jgi:hypothetical protein
MIRESLDPSARDADLVATAANGLAFQWRGITDQPFSSLIGDAQFHLGHVRAIPNADLKVPIMLRLTRRGNTVIAQYSKDGGKSFRPADKPLSFRPPLPRTLYAGLAITAGAEGLFTEAKFSGLEVQRK